MSLCCWLAGRERWAGWLCWALLWATALQPCRVDARHALPTGSATYDAGVPADRMGRSLTASDENMLVEEVDSLEALSTALQGNADTILLAADIDLESSPSLVISANVTIATSPSNSCTDPNRCRIFSSTTLGCGWITEDNPVFEDGGAAREPFFTVLGGHVSVLFYQVELSNGCLLDELTNVEIPRGSVLYSLAETLSLVFEDCYVHHNQVKSRGGVVYGGIGALEVLITGSSVFEGNRADSGGIVAGYGPYLEMEISGSSILTNNKARVFSGVAIGLVRLVVHILGEAVVTQNESFNFGGAFACAPCLGEVPFEFHVGEDALVADNLAVSGGVAFSSIDVHLLANGNALFKQNHAKGSGGVIQAFSGLVADVNGNAQFIQNTAALNGGVLHSLSNTEMTVEGSPRFVGNSAGYAGGVVYAKLMLDFAAFDYAAFEENTATVTGAVGSSVGDSYLIACGSSYFARNSAGQRGGAFCSSSLLEFYTFGNATFEENHAAVAGIVWASGHLHVSIENTVFRDNYATEQGCFGYVAEGALSIVTNNTLLVVNAQADCNLFEGGGITDEQTNVCNTLELFNTEIQVSTDRRAFSLPDHAWMMLHNLTVEPSTSLVDLESTAFQCFSCDYEDSPISNLYQCEALCQEGYVRASFFSESSSTCSLSPVVERRRSPFSQEALDGEDISDRVFLPKAGIHPTCAVQYSESVEYLPCANEAADLVCGLIEDSSTDGDVPAWAWCIIAVGAVVILALALVTTYYINKTVSLTRQNYRLLCRAFPEPIARRLRKGERVRERIDSAAIVFGDIQGFTKWSHGRAPEQIIGVLDTIFKRFDTVCGECGLVKVKTVGDCYMCAGGCFYEEEPHWNILRSAIFCWRCMEVLDEYRQRCDLAGRNGTDLRMRFGLCEGPACAGVIGYERLQYDLWSDTVNIAARMEGTSTAGYLQMTSKDAQVLEERFIDAFHFGRPRVVKVKGIGLLECRLLLKVNLSREEQDALLEDANSNARIRQRPRGEADSRHWFGDHWCACFSGRDELSRVLSGMLVLVALEALACLVDGMGVS
mmetsp:Transcript_3103/g.11169  ORF Transcript_3103/g.11169 Transcript_3103/m.11169 type:complete len:1054 (+) Transcript_3103:212-3373(+)